MAQQKQMHDRMLSCLNPAASPQRPETSPVKTDVDHAYEAAQLQVELLSNTLHSTQAEFKCKEESLLHTI